MSNLAGVQKLNYCDKKTGNNCKCSNIATFSVILKNRDNKDSLTAQQEWSYRCGKHSKTSTANKVVVESNPLDQSFSITIINRFLRSIINKSIKSKKHTAKSLIVKYVKNDKCGVMCFNEQSKKWLFVYYEQITSII